MATEFRRFCRLSEVPPGAKKAVKLDKTWVLVCNEDERLFDRAAQVGLPRCALRRVGEQREPFVDRSLVIAGDILLYRHEIARTRILGIERDRLVKGFGRGGGHRIARTRHHARLAKRRP